MSESQRTKVFISHSSKDKQFVRKLAQDLVESGLPVWVDEREILAGDSIVSKVEQGLESAKVVIAVISENSAYSRWVEKEVSIATMQRLSGEDILLLPIVIDDARIPTILQDLLYADFRSDYKAGLAKILSALKQESEDIWKFSGVGTSGSPCEDSLSRLKAKELRRRFERKLTRDDLGVIWYEVFGTRLDDDCPQKPLGMCTVEILARVDRESKTGDMIESLCSNFPFIINP